MLGNDTDGNIHVEQRFIASGSSWILHLHDMAPTSNMG